MRLNFEFMAKYLPLYIDAAKLTVEIAFWGIIFSLIVGIVCAVVRYYKIPVVHRIIAVYIEISRNTPLLVQLFFLFFGLPKIGIVLMRRSLRHYRTDFFRRQLYGRVDTQRT